MKKLLAVAVILMSAANGSLPALAAAPTQQELLQVANDLAHLYDTTYASRNPAAMALVYALDGILVSPAGPIVRGRDALRTYYARRFASGARDHKIKVLEVHVLGDGGYGLNAFSVMVPKADGTLREEHGSIVALYQHDADGWYMGLVAPSVAETAGK